MWEYNLLRHYGMTVAQYDEMVLEQDDKCYLCGQEEPRKRKGKTTRLSVDHNHRTGQIRRLLCSACNQGLGFFRENPLTLEKAAAYIRQFGGI